MTTGCCASVTSRADGYPSAASHCATATSRRTDGRRSAWRPTREMIRRRRRCGRPRGPRGAASRLRRVQPDQPARSAQDAFCRSGVEGDAFACRHAVWPSCAIGAARVTRPCLVPLPTCCRLSGRAMAERTASRQSLSRLHSCSSADKWSFAHTALSPRGSSENCKYIPGGLAFGTSVPLASLCHTIPRVPWSRDKWSMLVCALVILILRGRSTWVAACRLPSQADNRLIVGGGSEPGCRRNGSAGRLQRPSAHQHDGRGIMRDYSVAASRATVASWPPSIPYRSGQWSDPGA